MLPYGSVAVIASACAFADELAARAGDDEAAGRGGADGDGEPVAAAAGERAVVGDDVGGLDLVELEQAGGDTRGEGERRVGGAEVLVGCEAVAEGRRGDGARRARGAGEGEHVVAGVAEVDVAVRVGRGHGRGLRGARSLGGGAGNDQPACRGGDGDGETVGAGARDDAVVGDDVGGLDLVELEQAGGDAGGERERRVGGAEVLVGREAVAEGRGGDRVRRAVGAGEGERVVARVRGVGVAVRVGRGHRCGLRGAGDLRRATRDDEAARRCRVDGDAETVAAGGARACRR